MCIDPLLCVMPRCSKNNPSNSMNTLDNMQRNRFIDDLSLFANQQVQLVAFHIVDCTCTIKSVTMLVSH